MDVSFQHPNPDSGNESVLLAFDDSAFEHTKCLLIDAGSGVDLGELLTEDDELIGICLTHAHLDHYQEVAGALQDDIPVFVSPGTERILETVFGEAVGQYELDDQDDVIEAIVGVTGWQEIASGVQLGPVPAGHAPGAVGWMIRVVDGDTENHLLATGDWTSRRCTGYPGMESDYVADVDVVFATASTNDGYEETLTTSLATCLTRARAGSAVLGTMSGLTGVQYAYLLGHLIEQVGDAMTVRIVGQLAKIYEDFDYDVPNVESTPVFNNPRDLIEPGHITLAGPETPIEGSAAKLFDVIENDPEAVLVQVKGAGTDTVDGAGCTVHGYDLINHPTREEFFDLVRTLDPRHIIVKHQMGDDLDRFANPGDYERAVVWANQEPNRYPLYEDGQWQAPPWMGEDGFDRTLGQHHGRLPILGDDELDPPPLPSIERTSDVDFEAEGVMVETINQQLSADIPRSFDHRDGRDPSEATDGSAQRALAADGDPPVPISSDSDDNAAQRSRTEIHACVLEGAEDVTLLQVLDDVSLEHGDEVTITLNQQLGA